MKYTTKLYISFLITAFLSAFFGISSFFLQTRSYLFRELQSKVISIASTTAALMDGDQLKLVQTPQDETLPPYISVRDYLRKARNANRSASTYVKFLYTLKPDPKNPKSVIFLVDAEESPKDVSHVGDTNEGAIKDEFLQHVEDKYSFGRMNSDQWGTWLTGYAPVYDSQGKYVGTVGADISATLILQSLNRLLYFAFPSMLAAIGVAMLIATLLSRRAALALSSITVAAKELGAGNFDYRIDLTTGDEFDTVSESMNQMAASLQEKERLKSGFAHYVSQYVMEKIVQGKDLPKLEGERRKITVFFSDIRDFTAISEKLPPEQVVAILNEFFNCMLGIIFKYNGMLDKFTGDGMMAEFGAPIEDPEQEKHAVLAAIEMQNALSELRKKWAAEGKPRIEMGVGIHTGEAIIGSIGSSERMEYTAIGDTVNVASRLEHITKEKGFPIIVSETTFAGLKEAFPYNFLGEVTLPGRTAPIRAYSIIYKKEDLH